MLKVLDKIRDCKDIPIYLVVLMDNEEQLSVMADAIVSCGRDRFVYELYKDDITAYMIEIRMPYNRYLAMMNYIQRHGWNLKPESDVNIFHRMIKWNIKK